MNNNSRTDRERIVDAEIALTHLQQDCEALNGVVLEQQKLIEQLTVKIQRLVARVGENADPEVRDAESERPPHY